MKDCNEQVRGYHQAEVKMNDFGREDIFKKAKANRTRLRNGLARDDRPTPVGSRTQGSYAMRTMIHDPAGDYDIDDGVYFKKEDLVGERDGEMSALAVRQMVCAALQDDRFTEVPEVLKNCVRVYYQQGYHVDVPAYRRVRTTDPLTGITSDKYELAGAYWKASDALSVTKWFRDQNKALCSDATGNGNNGQFVRVVRLVKAFARSRPHWNGKMASGFALTKLVAEHYREDTGRDDQALREVLRAIRDRLEYNDGVRHPTLDENIADPGSARTAFLRSKLVDKLPCLDVLDDPDCTHDQAMRAWDKFFKSEWFRIQPDPADEEDLENKTKAPAVIKSGGQGYA
ncbi:cyclic GMP-AMP synthase DncV-like nucleotidyltransferase [Bosea vaviloviae]|uniref:Cyclic GMP-AMP synthase n=1 Tax=Bosea vaviloviae TaxID=1526658 RepID=A0A1D7U4H7_9HYPH|nr:hypothetical protein [Bosea vaviloviae]AOO82280.1 hypothetical protein BHK69_19160 [Bosea vaviloviae]